VKLILGVIDVPYANSAPEHVKRVRTISGKKGRATAIAAPATPSAFKSTGDVAQILEDKYHIMQTFFDIHKKDIAKAMEESIGEAFETLISRSALSNVSIDRNVRNSTNAAASDIERMFKNAISMREFDGRIKGAPTQASLDGVNHRLKHPYSKKNPARPSFRDTGLYQASMKAWFE